MGLATHSIRNRNIMKYQSSKTQKIEENKEVKSISGLHCAIMLVKGTGQFLFFNNVRQINTVDLLSGILSDFLILGKK